MNAESTTSKGCLKTEGTCRFMRMASDQTTVCVCSKVGGPQCGYDAVLPAAKAYAVKHFTKVTKVCAKPPKGVADQRQFRHGTKVRIKSTGQDGIIRTITTGEGGKRLAFGVEVLAQVSVADVVALD